MEVLYVDVYFLLNFTVDTLALYFASKLLRLRLTLPRLLFVGALGGIFAITDVMLENNFPLRIINTALYLILVALFLKSKITLIRRLKLLFSFYIIEIIIGGSVYYGFTLLDKYFKDALDGLDLGASNRNALLFALVLLIAIGVLRIIIMLLSGNVDGKNVLVKIEIEDKVIECEALLDSGNLVKDPMSMCPVLFVRPHLAKSFLPEEIISLEGIDSLDYSYRKRIRLIPVSYGNRTVVYTGVRVDRVSVMGKNGFHDVDVTLVIDKEEGSYSGYSALAPSVIVE